MCMAWYGWSKSMPCEAWSCLTQFIASHCRPLPHLVGHCPTLQGMLIYVKVVQQLLAEQDLQNSGCTVSSSRLVAERDELSQLLHVHAELACLTYGKCLYIVLMDPPAPWSIRLIGHRLLQLRTALLLPPWQTVDWLLALLRTVCLP